MKALIIGATGATGQDLVQVLLEDGGYREIVAFVRKSTGRSHPKYTEIITDFEKIGDVVESITGDVWFSCLGTTLKAAGSKEKQRQIDYDMPLAFARIARNQGVRGVVQLSAYGASVGSRVFYSRMKGELDDEISSLGFDPCIIFRPGMLLRKRTDRAGEQIMGSVLKFLNRMGIAKKYRPLPTLNLAEKMAQAPKLFPSGKRIIELNAIFDL